MKNILNFFRHHHDELMTPPQLRFSKTAFGSILTTLACAFFPMKCEAGTAGANDELDPRCITASKKIQMRATCCPAVVDEGVENRLKAIDCFKRQRIAAFTLAEAVIAIAVVGIVAATTITTFIPKINAHVRERQISAAKIKFTKALEVMSLNEDLGPYYSDTADFVNNLQKYFKVAKVCDNEHLKDCFGYDKIDLGDGQEFEINEITDGRFLGKNRDYGETIGLITLDGTSMLISWNKDCDMIPPNVYQWAGDTNETSKCTAVVMDINGDKTPNKINKDISTLNANLGCGVKFTYDGEKYCWDTPFAPTPLTNADCVANGTNYGIKNCYNFDYDYWGGAMKQCKEQGKRLPNSSELATLAKYLYGTDSITDNGDTTYASNSGLTMNPNTLADSSGVLSSSYKSNGSYFYIWSGAERSASQSWYRVFYINDNTLYTTNGRNTADSLGICVQ